jgi:uncharacterized protein (TIGR02145 family)
MKKKFLFTIAMLLLKIGIQAQDYKITFESTNQEHPLDYVEIVNISNGTTMTIPGSGKLLLGNETTQVSDHPDYPSRLWVYPNPLTESSIIEFFNNKQGLVHIELYDVAGRLILRQLNKLPKGSHVYEVSALVDGLYFMNIQTPSERFSGKLISAAPDGSSPRIVYMGEGRNGELSPMIKNDNVESFFMEYNDGDRIHFRGKSGDRTLIYTWTPTMDSILEFDFIPCNDADGNHYPIVKIGDQLWMAENLKATRFSNGTPIDHYEANHLWKDNLNGEYGWYDNDISWKDIYGGLYSWYAVDNSVGLCPIGWHVPSNEEWIKLEQYICTQLGNDECETQFPMEWNIYENLYGTNEGNALKSCRQLNSTMAGNCSIHEHPRWEEGVSGTDEFGFAALPGGEFQPTNESIWIGLLGSWWTSSALDHAPIVRSLHRDLGTIYRGDYSSKGIGLSVRCIREYGLATIHELKIIVAPDDAGNVSGSGEYEMGSEIEISFTSETGYKFAGWILNGKMLSTDAEFIYTMPAENVTLVASFVEEHDNHQPGSGVKDIDGNFYPSVIIGNQEWLTENLKTTRYRNGIPIEYPGIDDATWINNSMGAYAWNQNDTIWKSAYGALYNWFAINNANGLCPAGWFIPERSDWYELGNYVANNGYSMDDMFDLSGPGKALKSCRQVSSILGEQCETTEHPRWNADDSFYGVDAFGFSAVPGGVRRYDGSYFIPGAGAYWWASTENSDNEAWGFRLSYNYSYFMPHIPYKNEGQSVRCVRKFEIPE